MEVVIILKLIFSLAIVIGLIFALSYTLKKYIIKFPYQGKTEDIKIRDIKFIYKDKGFATVEFDKKIFLIAFDSSKLSIIYTKNINEERSYD